MGAKKINPCEGCERSFVGCKFVCQKLALLDAHHKEHNLAVFFQKANEEIETRYEDAGFEHYDYVGYVKPKNKEKERVQEGEKVMSKKQNETKNATKLYLMWLKKDEVVLIKANDEAEATQKVLKDYPQFKGTVTRAEWGDKYACVSEIPDTILAKNNIQPRCRKCDCLLPLEGFKTKHGRAYCSNCIDGVRGKK